jgi:uncharacterized membrane protein YozB (DUF420 family)
MTSAPTVSTIIAIGLIPVAFLYLHAFFSGLNKWKYHKISGSLAVIWDLSMSIGYMIYRALGGQVQSSTLNLSGPVSIYFIVHGIIALIVILLEVSVFVTGLLQWKWKRPIAWHKKLVKPLFFLWWFAFLSGEIFYVTLYVI